MTRALAAVALAFAAPARADDALPAETVGAVKRATVFVRVAGDGWAATGSGFAAAADATAVLIVTNHHVAAPTPPPGRPAGKPPTVTVVFGSGTKAERAYPAELAAADPVRDLAVLRVAGVKDAPAPIPYADPPAVAETTPVYTFGFPFGQALSGTSGFPAVTVGKASVSSLRNGPDGELAAVQLDGNLNPGNSGGPVVDGKGRLVGVAVSRVKDGQGIGLAVPAAEVGRLMRGRVGRVRVLPKKAADGTVTLRVEADLIDPAGLLRSPTAHYLVVAPKAKRPDGPALDKVTGSKPLALTVAKGVAAAEVAVGKAEGDVLVQVVADAGAGRPREATAVRAFPLALPTAAELAGPPPAGWKEYAPRDKTFVMWVPEKPARQADEERNFTLDGKPIRVNTVLGRTADGLTYEAQSVLLPPAFAKAARKDLYDLFRGAVAAEAGGRVTESKEATAGGLPGVEFRVEAGAAVARARLVVSGPRVYMVRVTGAADQADGAEGETLLGAFRPPGPPAVVAKGPTELPGPRAKDPTVVGGANDPVFKDAAPAGGLLVGLEVGLGPGGGGEVIRAVRPVYRAGGKEVPGAQRGTQLTRVVALKAKDGYAVGAVTCKSGLTFDGCSVTFMRVVDGGLDPKDAYESEWVGFNGPARPAKVGGDGTPVVGVVGKATAKDVTGLGLLFRGQEGFDPNPPVGPKGKDPTMVGWGGAPGFKDAAPDGGLLVGLEVGLVKHFGREVIRTVRPVYRLGDKEATGEQYGKERDRVVTVTARAGYAVGAVTVKHGLACEGWSVTFMKVADGKLDPKDAYESEWVGAADTPGATTTKLGDGTPVVGVVGRTNDRHLLGFGLLFKGQEAFEPRKK